MTNTFEAVTTLTPDISASGMYTGHIDETWTLRPMPQGGVVTAIAVRAMQHELSNAEQTLRTLHTTYVAPVDQGPVQVEVEVLRRGRSMSHLRAEVRNPGASHGHVTVAVFGSTRRGFEFTDLEPPSGFTPLSEARSFRAPAPPGFEFESPFWDLRLEGRAAYGHAPWEDYIPQRAEHGTWYRLDDPPMGPDGCLDALALVVMADTMPGATGEKVGPAHRRGWFAPSVDLTFHLLNRCRSEWVYAHNRARFAGDGYASLDMALWDFGPAATADAPTLVAYATQVCLFSFSSDA